MLSGNRHWLEYDSVALVALFFGMGFVALIVLGILSRARKLDMGHASGREATTYTLKFNEEENGLTFAIGCSDFSTNRAFIWTSWMACPVQPDAGDSAERARLRSSPDCQAEDARF